MTAPRYVLIANPGTKRCETYRAELAAYWADRGVTPDVTVVPWAEVIPRDGDLDDLPAFDRPALVRLESPGKCDDVTRLLLEAGARDADLSPRDWRSLGLPKGLLVLPGLQHRGFCRVLRGLRQSFNAKPHLRPAACPLAVATMFDKTETCRLIRAAGVPVPEMLAPGVIDPGMVYDRVREKDWRTAYVKLNTGSSATGIIVLHPIAAGRPPAGVTTLVRRDMEFYNSRLLTRLSGTELDRAVEFVLYQGAIVQRGIPMAQIDGQNFDVRVVCVYGKPVAHIFRLSPNPMTNLHLGGRRGDFAHCRAHVPTRRWLDALDHCAEAAACFDSAVAGVDLLFERGYGNHFVLEVNAFGDFFPGWTDARGRSIHAIEIDATANR
jgi:hypothetical protein